MKKILTNKKFLAVYFLWVAIHTFLYLSSTKYLKSDFWPFTDNSYDTTYDASEWFVYTIGPLVLLLLITAFANDLKPATKDE